MVPVVSPMVNGAWCWSIWVRIRGGRVCLELFTLFTFPARSLSFFTLLLPCETELLWLLGTDKWVLWPLLLISVVNYKPKTHVDSHGQSQNNSTGAHIEIGNWNCRTNFQKSILSSVNLKYKRGLSPLRLWGLPSFTPRADSDFKMMSLDKKIWLRCVLGLKYF